MEYKFIEPQIKTGKEEFRFKNKPTGATLSDYWPWAHSDLIGNTERGKLAEFIVATALGVSDKIGTTWSSFDLTFMDKGVEVKSSAYCQTWFQEKESNITFGCQPTFAWDDTTGKYASDRKRQADVYVFCLLKHKDKTTLDPLNLDQWEFYIVPTSLLNELVPTQKSISLLFLQKKNIAPCAYDEIRTRVEDTLNNMNANKKQPPVEKVNNKDILVVAYKEYTDNKFQTSMHVDMNKTEAAKYYRDKGLVPIAQITYENYLDYMKGTYVKNGMDRLDKNFVRKEVGKFFNND